MSQYSGTDPLPFVVAVAPLVVRNRVFRPSGGDPEHESLGAARYGGATTRVEGTLNGDEE